MKRLREIVPDLRDILFFVFNVSSIRKACKLCLLSKEFLYSFSIWGMLVIIILLQSSTHMPVPALLLAFIKIFSVFAGCCWVALPVFIYLEIKMHRQLQRTLKPNQMLQFVAGISLWQQAARGRLPVQFFGAIIVGIWLAFFAFCWPMNTSWQALFILAFLMNITFFLIFPLFLFLKKWINQGILWEFHRGGKRLTSYSEI